MDLFVRVKSVMMAINRVVMVVPLNAWLRNVEIIG